MEDTIKLILDIKRKREDIKRSREKSNLTYWFWKEFNKSIDFKKYIEENV
jgi:hypothetical protein